MSKPEDEKRKPTLWDCSRDSEVLTHSDPEAAVDDWLGNDFVGELSDAPEEVTVFGFAPVIVDEARRSCEASRVLEGLIEQLDEDLGSPDDYTKPTEEMEALARTFVDGVLELYHVWSCEQISEESVPTRAAERFRLEEPEATS